MEAGCLRAPRLPPCSRQGGMCTPPRPWPPPLAYRVEVGALVLGAVAGVAKGLLAARVLAQVRLLARVAPQVDLEVLQPREGLAAAFKLRERPVSSTLQPPEGPPPAWTWPPAPSARPTHDTPACPRSPGTRLAPHEVLRAKT